jgi:hypothetical protein
MKRTWIAAVCTVAGVAVSILGVRPAPARRMMVEEDFFVESDFRMLDPALGGRHPAGATAPWLAGSTIAATADGALVIDADSGRLVKVDRTGRAVAVLGIGAEATQLVYDPTGRRAYVADRRGDRIAVVDVGDALVMADSLATAAEPWGLALSPDRRTLLVTAVADRTLQAFAVGTGRELWRRGLDREPRGVALASDGKSAIVTYLNTGTVERFALGVGEVGLTVGGSRQVALAQSPTQPNRRGLAPAEGFARGAFAVRFLGAELAVVAHQISTPQQEAAARENAGSYGGGFAPPVSHRLAFVAAGGGEAGMAVATAQIGVHMPDAIAYRSSDDLLLVAGLGSDELLAVSEASQPSVALRAMVSLRGTASERCGPNGIAAAEEGEIYVYCSLSRRVAVVTLGAAIGGAAATTAHGEPVAESRLSAVQRRGRELFFAGDDATLSLRGALACASCHPEGRTDGLSWRIEGRSLQTPVLAGRIAGTMPYKWDGGDPTLASSLKTTVRRLGGAGLTDADARALASFVESMPRPRHPAKDRAAVARGKALFQAESLGCSDCHSGPLLTDRQTHDVETDLEGVDTPSLVGLAASAPYYHDGSAGSLRALLLENGSVHDMGNPAALRGAELDDLIAYLETL